MKTGKLMATAGLIVFAVSCVQSATVVRDTNGEWFDDAANWNNLTSGGNNFPSSGDVARVEVPNGSTPVTVTQRSAPVSVNVLTIGLGNVGAKAKLVIQTNLTTGTTANIAISGNSATGEIAVDGGTLDVGSYLTVGHSSNGFATLSVTNDGQVVISGKMDVKGKGVVVMSNRGTVDIGGSLLMEDGATVYLSGKSQILIEGNQTSDEDLLSYISNGWIYGNGEAGLVDVSYDEGIGKTVLEVAFKPQINLVIMSMLNTIFSL